MAATSIDEHLRERVSRWDAAGLGRRLEHRNGVDFCTNDYLGLAADVRLVAAAVEALERHGVGAKAARLLGGHREAHAHVEDVAARWLGAERALLLPSGYHANLAALQTLVGPGDLVLSDERNHASLIDGMRLARGRVHVFAHNDACEVERHLTRAGSGGARYVVCESVYSIDGSRAPLADYADLAAHHDAWLIVDEAHAAGLCGERGAGLAAGLPRVVSRTITCGKALGVSGALLAGTRAFVDALVNEARSFVFTTAPMPAMAAAIARAIEVAWLADAARSRLADTAMRLRGALAARGIATSPGGAIVFVPLGAPEAAMACAAAVRAAGYEIGAVRPPTVPEGQSGLRIVCHADHTAADVDGLAAALAHAWRPTATPPSTRRARPLVVVGTDTGVGKTVVSALLLRAARRAGARTGYWKPVQTGTDTDTPRVAALAGPDEAPSPAVELARPASVDQAARHQGVRVTVAEVLKAARRHLERAPGVRWVLETAGGLRVPFNEDEDQADLLAALGAPLVLVARSGLGTLNHTLLTVEALARRRLRPRALVLVGDPHSDNETTLRDRLPGVALFSLHRLEPLDGQALEAWLDGNDLEAVWS